MRVECNALPSYGHGEVKPPTFHQHLLEIAQGQDMTVNPDFVSVASQAEVFESM